MNDETKELGKIFDDIKNLTYDGLEYWSARELMTILDYKKWEKFKDVIIRAKKACENSKQNAEYHFPQSEKMVELGSGSVRKIEDFILTRYACYLIAQNSDPTKEAVALAQTYFALQTYKQEVYEQRIKENHRLDNREKLKKIEGEIEETVYHRGIAEPYQFAKFKDEHIKAFYGGLSTKQIKKMRGIQEKRALADFDTEIELAAKSLSYALTDKNIKDKKLFGEKQLVNEAVGNATAIRSTLEQRGVKPELLKPEEDIKLIKRRRKEENKKLALNSKKKLLENKD
jgi:DNA-damage-inducible protein D